MSVQDQYEQVMRDALEDVFVVAARQGLDTAELGAEFDADRGPGLFLEHTLTISVRDTSLLVKAEGIPHAWLSTGTGFIDTRFSRQISMLMSELAKQAERAGRYI